MTKTTQEDTEIEEKKRQVNGVTRVVFGHTLTGKTSYCWRSYPLTKRNERKGLCDGSFPFSRRKL